MTQEQLFLVLVLAAGLLTLGYFRGRRINLGLARAIGSELERTLHPKDQTYTWLGGVLGFRAEYRSNGAVPRVEATLTLLPRHSLLYLPVARLLSGGDRLFVVAHPREPVRGEAHVIAASYRRRLGRLAGESGWRRETVDAGGEVFEVVGGDPGTVAGLRDWLRSLPRPHHLRHLALVPRTGTLYLYLVPVRGEVKPIVESALAWSGAAAARG
ncbi:MAG: hypothetical protein HY575_09245 [candidate division NC10 bacterium]|nr:hypothetical protein [candidate division NC10 bacterium]